ncbi:aldo/keto reductase [Burkholderia sp. F1]|uniref:aldo/keto reductase n=1 Tax=Burkholderia sp. F1 TaxID=3366817 RepID=UPI003D706404
MTIVNTFEGIGSILLILNGDSHYGRTRAAADGREPRPRRGGLLTAKYRHDRQGRLTDWGGRVIRLEDSAQRTGILDAVLAIADECGHRPAQVALAWTLARARGGPARFVPVLGPRSRAQLDACLDSLSIGLEAAQLARLDAVSAVQAGSPHEVGANALARMLGDERHRVEPRNGAPA